VKEKNEGKFKHQIAYAKKNLVKISIDTKVEFREEFKKTCKDNNTTPTKVLKDFITKYIEKNKKV